RNQLERSGIGSGAILPNEVLSHGTHPNRVVAAVGGVQGVHGAAAPDSPQWRKDGYAETLAFSRADDSTSEGRATVDRIRTAAHGAGRDVTVACRPRTSTSSTRSTAASR